MHIPRFFTLAAAAFALTLGLLGPFLNGPFALLGNHSVQDGALARCAYAAEPDSTEVSLSSTNDAATMQSSPFGVNEFQRLEKGSNRPIQDTYHGYSYLSPVAVQQACVVDATSFVVVHVPQADAQQWDMANENSPAFISLQSMLCALDAVSADGLHAVSANATWYFTAEDTITVEGVTFSFNQSYGTENSYVSVMGENGQDPTASGNLSLSHCAFFAVPPTEDVALTPEKTPLEHIGAFFAELDWSPLWVTLKTTGAAMIFIFSLGLLAAWGALRVSPRAQDILDTVLTIPMVLPPTVCGFLLLLLLGSNTPIGAWFDSVGFPLVFSWPATVIAAFVVAFPLMYRSARGAFESLDSDMINAARTLGWSEARIFLQIMLPLTWSSIAAGAILSFARALGEFGATLFLAGNYLGITRTIPIAIYFEWMGGNTDVALFWTMVVLLLSFAVIFSVNIANRKTNRFRTKDAGHDR